MGKPIVKLGTLTMEAEEVKRWNLNPDRKADRHKGRVKPANRPFVAWDGEGYSDENNEHHTMLWGCSTGQWVKGKSLQGFTCLDLLLSVAAERPAIHVIFGGGYDVVMLIRNFPLAKQKRIIKGLPTWHGGYRLEYFKGKYLRVGDGKRSCTLFDVFTFFSTSFVKACREYLGDNPDFDRIEQVKLMRDSFTEENLEELVIPYWLEELKYLVELCDILRTRLRDAGIEPTQWHGPGAVASAVLKAKGIKAHMSATPEGVREASRYAYFGGRFEQFKIGYHNPGDIGERYVYQYDIRSAYPFAITRLPSLASIEWIHRQKRKGTFDAYGLYRISYHANEKVSLAKCGPLPWRRKNKSIYYPHDICEGWYWGIELQMVQEWNTGTITVMEAWEPASMSTNKPFTFVQQMYDDRAKMKAEGNPTQLALKLAMNSLYGKLAQSKGAKIDDDGKWRIPTYHQLEWAGWITAATRARLYNAMMMAGSGLIAVETDAVYSMYPLPLLPTTTALGDWEKEELDGILYVQSGVYFKREGDKWKLKSRGFEPRGHTYDNWSSKMAHLPAEPETVVKLNVRRFGGIPGSENFAKWYEMERTSTILQMASKRVHFPSECYWCSLGRIPPFNEIAHTLIVPDFLINADSEPSAPHSLPWIDPELIPQQEEDWLITEEDFMQMGFEL